MINLGNVKKIPQKNQYNYQCDVANRLFCPHTVKNIMVACCYYTSPSLYIIICLQAWERLERAEHERERVLRDELIRQEKLEQMARRFDRKAAMRETWLLENQRLVAQVTHQGQN